MKVGFSIRNPTFGAAIPGSGRVARPFGSALTDPADGFPASGCSRKSPTSGRGSVSRVGDSRLAQARARGQSLEPVLTHASALLPDCASGGS